MAGVLSGYRVLVTRPLAQAEPWCEQLRACGADAVAVPVLALAPVTGADQCQAIKQRIMDFDLYQKAIFVSRNAVHYAFEWLEDFWPQLPMGIEYYAVGDATARALADHGVAVSALTAAQSGAMTSETLLAAPDLQAVTGQKIVIFRGCGGRGAMAEILRERGAQVDYCELYERLLPEGTAQALARALPPEGETLVTVHSGESLTNLVTVLNGLTTSPDSATLAQYLWRQPLVVPGNRVAGLAREAGFDRVIMAENATDPAMFAALERYVNRS
ncbi:uroporphyrinogen-III synthase [Marinimicrobium alkaliphilum]|uniref:uroporphyrinogen-III synthase n=1 Tax=Marinimicrobium alkaliphilum TaxID=2202654 RepID=UPI001E352B35|nr:uroporphyrinogen-III synthase [Marinimicrobium alkaliphilum]